MDEKLSALPTLTTLLNANLVYVVSAGVSYSVTVAELKANLAPYTEQVTISGNVATLSNTPISIVSFSVAGGVLAPGSGNDYTISGETVTTPNIASGVLLATYYK